MKFDHRCPLEKIHYWPHGKNPSDAHGCISDEQLLHVWTFVRRTAIQSVLKEIVFPDPETALKS